MLRLFKSPHTRCLPTHTHRYERAMWFGRLSAPSAASLAILGMQSPAIVAVTRDIGTGETVMETLETPADAARYVFIRSILNVIKRVQRSHLKLPCLTLYARTNAVWKLG